MDLSSFLICKMMHRFFRRCKNISCRVFGCRTMFYPRDAPRILLFALELEAAPASSEGWASSINKIDR
jgi:hypothetical protein